MSKRKKLILVGSLVTFLLIAAIVAIFLLRKEPTLHVSRDEVTLYLGETTTLKYETNQEKKLEWSSENKEIATVYHGLVKGIAIGTTTIKAYVNDELQKEVKVSVIAPPLEGYDDILTYVGEPPVDIKLNETEEYSYVIEEHQNGEYTSANNVAENGLVDTNTPGNYRITYTIGDNQYTRYVRVNPLQELADFAVIENFDGTSVVKTASSQFSEPETYIRGSEQTTEYVTYTDSTDINALHESLDASGYDGYVNNHSIVSVEKKFSRNNNYGSYLYLDITPMIQTFFDKTDEFDDEASLSLWYRATSDNKGAGDYKTATGTYNYLLVEKADGTITKTEKYHNKIVRPRAGGWSKWEINFNECGELVGAKRIMIVVGRWGAAGAGNFRCDFYSLETESILIDAVTGRNEMEYKWSELVPYVFPTFSIQNMNQDDFAIYTSKGKLLSEGEDKDYQKTQYNKKDYISNLDIGTYEFKYHISGVGLKTDDKGLYVVEFPVNVINPSLAGIISKGRFSYFTSHDWEGGIGSKNAYPAQDAKIGTLSDADYKALLDAGYIGAIQDKKVGYFEIDTKMVNKNQARCVGLLFPDSVKKKIDELVQNEKNAENYYMSVWVRMSNETEQTVTTTYGTAVYDRSSKVGSNGIVIEGEERKVYRSERETFYSGQWTEIRIPLTIVASAYKEFATYNSAASENVFGVSLPWLSVTGDKLTSPLKIEVYGAEILCNEVEITVGESADLKVETAVYMEDIDYTWEIYQGSKKLVKNKDYTVTDKKGLVASGLKEGEYVIQYSGLNGVIQFKRKLIVNPKEQVLDTLLSKSSMTYYTSHDWKGSINTGNTNPVQSTKTVELSDEVYQALVEAGYAGKVTGKQAQNITIDLADIKANNAARTLGLMFSEADIQNLKKFSDDAKVASNYYVSVWIKMNYGSTANVSGMVVDRKNKLQANSTGETSISIQTEKDTWTELQIPLTRIRKAYKNFSSWNGSATAEDIAGLWFDWFLCQEDGKTVSYPNGAKLSIDIYSVEIMYNTIHTKTEKATDISIQTDMIAPNLKYDYEIIYAGKTLTTGKDYEHSGKKVTLKNEGIYNIKYTVYTNLDVYAENFVFYRNVDIPVRASVPNMSIGNNDSYFTSHDWKGSINTAHTNAATDTKQSIISAEDYDALLKAGYSGNDTVADLNVSKISIDMDKKVDTGGGINAARTVGILYSDAFNTELKRFIYDDNLKDDYYVSVWVKMSADSRSNATAIVVDRENKKQANPTGHTAIPIEFEKDTWTEVKLPLSYVRKSHANFVDWYKDATEQTFGLYLDWLMVIGGDAYPAGTVLDIQVCDAQIKYNDLSVREKDAIDVSIKTDVIAKDLKYTFSCYDGNKKLSKGEDYTVEGNNVTFKAAGIYTVKYTIQTSREEYLTNMDLYRTIEVIALKSVPELSFGELQYFTSHTWNGAIASSGTNALADMPEVTLTDKEYTALQKAGFNGKLTNEKVGSVTLDMSVVKEGNRARTIGILFPDTITEELKSYASDSAYTDNYYLSVWMKLDFYGKSDMEISVFDRNQKKQGSATSIMSVTLAKDTWTEIKIPLSYVASAYQQFIQYNAGHTEEVFGLRFKWLTGEKNGAAYGYTGGEKLQLMIAGAGIRYNGLTTKINASTDVSIDTDILEPDMNYSITVYQNGTKLTSGEDYTKDGRKLTFSKSGLYVLKYKLSSPDYKKSLSIYRSLSVKENLSIGLATRFYASHTWQGVLSSANTTSSVANTYTLDNQELQLLKTAGAKSDSTQASKISIDMSDTTGGNLARSVGIIFPDTVDGKLKELVNNPTAIDNYYLSVWIKTNAEFKTHSNGTKNNLRPIVLDMAKKLQSSSALDRETNIPANTWTELKISLSDIAVAYDNFTKNNANATENIFGIWFTWIINGDNSFRGISTLNIDVYGAEVVAK